MKKGFYMKNRILATALCLALIFSALSLSSCFLLDAGTGGSSTINYSKEDLDAVVNEILKDRLETNFDINSITVNSSEPSSLIAASKGVLSSVSVYSTFTVKTYVGFGPIRDWGTTETTAAGSGVIFQMSSEDKISGNAYIITNYHVVYNAEATSKNHIADKIELYLYGMEKEKYAIPATYVGGSMMYDIAVLKVSASDVLRKSNAIEATFADSDDVTILETAIAIGNPEASGISATVGHINVDSEYVEMVLPDEQTVSEMRLMRIDTAVNGGNSGGGLFNERGEVIGIVNAKITSSTIDNIGYAIPANVARLVAENIIHYEATGSECGKRGTIGITLSSDPDSYTSYDKETGKVHIIEKVVIADVNKGSLADGKLQVGDEILLLKIGENEPHTVTRYFNVVERMLGARVGDTVVFTIVRGTEQMELSFTITEASLNDII